MQGLHHVAVVDQADGIADLDQMNAQILGRLRRRLGHALHAFREVRRGQVVLQGGIGRQDA